MSGIESDRVHLRASPSSITTTEPGRARARARTADSPAPRSQAATSGGVGMAGAVVNQPARSIDATVGSAGPWARISRSTGSGTETSNPPARSSSSRSSRARKTRGEAFTIR